MKSADITIPEISIDTITINISEKELSTYYTFDIITDPYSNHSYFYGYNHVNHSFDLFNLTEEIFIRSVNLEYRGPNGIPTIGLFKVISQDSILVNASPYYAILNSNGKIVAKKKGNELLKDDKYIFGPSHKVLFGNNNLCIYKKDFFLFINPINCPPFSNEYFDSNLITQNNFNYASSKKLHINYPDELKANMHYGYLTVPYISHDDNNLIYNFPFSSDIYIYDYQKDTSKIYTANSIFTTNKCRPVKNNESLANHQITSMQFHQVTYDPYSGMYYQVHNDYQSKINGKKQKRFFLTILDTNFCKVTEFELDQNLFPYNYYPSPDGVIFQTRATRESNLDELNFYRFNL